jgi:sec1 family domain-containing protein 1
VLNVLASGQQKLPISRTVEAALGGDAAGAGSELSWLDPRAARTDAAARSRAARHPPPTDAVVFVVGGGNYIEYHNLIDFAKVPLLFLFISTHYYFFKYI